MIRKILAIFLISSSAWATSDLRATAIDIMSTLKMFDTSGTSALSITQASLSGTPYSISLPGVQGAANSCLLNNGSGNLSWTIPTGTGISALTGDVTASGTGSVVATLATVNASPGTTAISTITTNGKGLVTANSAASTTGSGNVVLATSPTLSSPVVGTQASSDNSTLAASTAYVQTALAQLNPAAAVIAASTANVAGTYTNAVSGVCIGDTFQVTSTAAFVLDGITPTVGQRILLKDQTSTFQNGVWTLTTAANVGVIGALLTRATDFDSSTDINAGQIVPVAAGTVNAGSSWYQTATNTTCNTSAQTWTQFQAPSSSYLSSALASGDIYVGNSGGTAAAVAMSGTGTISNTGVFALANTAVTAGSYTLADITVGADGRITAASNGSGSGCSAWSYNTQSGSSYTLALGDLSIGGSCSQLLMTSASANAVTVPTNASVALGVGAEVDLSQQGTGLTNVAPASGVTINGCLGFAKQFGLARMFETALNTWFITGDVACPVTATGGVVTYAGGNEIHTFTSSGSFIITAVSGSPNLEVLVVAGGGAGGPESSGGAGGAGQVQHIAALGATTGTFTVTVGAGATSALSGLEPNGANSVFGSITALGGGGGGNTGQSPFSGNNGGSGGGGSNQSGSNAGGSGNTTGSGGATAYGNGGGASGGGGSAPYYSTGGGGGAGGIGGTGSGSVSGAGGSGQNFSTSGSSVCYAGGGGGGVRSSGTAGTATCGGGAGGTASALASSGTANTGGGGGGGGNTTGSALGGNGGSGIVIVSFPQY